MCDEARAQLTERDRAYVFAYQQLDRETAHALAGLGRMEEAKQLSERLLEECEDCDNPLLTGLLHHDRARIACIDQDRAGFEEHAAATRTAFASTDNPALIIKAQRLLALARTNGLIEADTRSQTDHSGLAFSGLVRNALAERALSEIVEAVGAHFACMYLVLYGRAVLSALHGQVESSALLSEHIGTLVRTLEREVDDQRVREVLSQAPSELGSDLSLVPLLARVDGHSRQLVGIVVLGDCDRPGALGQLDLAEIADDLAQDEEATEVG